MKERLSKVSSLVVLVGVTLLFLYILSPFFFPVFWAAIIAALARPFYDLLNRKKHLPNLNALATIFLLLVVLLLPLTLIGTMLIDESVRLYDTIEQGTFSDQVEKTLEALQNTRLMQHFNIDSQMLTAKLSELAADASKFIFNSLGNLTQNLIVFLVMFAVMIYTLYYLLRDGDRILKACFRLFPLNEKRSRIIMDQFLTITKASLRSTLILGGLQGIAGGALFWLTGIEAPIMWGVLMMLTSVLPIGSTIIWAPAGIIMLFLGRTWQGLTILLVGTFVVGIIDNLLRPLLVGRETQLHPLLIFLSTMGGLVVFGFSGFIIGPVIASVLLSLWTMFEAPQAHDPPSEKNIDAGEQRS